MKLKLPSLHRLSPIFTVLVFCFAGVVIYLELRAHSLSEIATDIMSIPSEKVFMALALVVPGLVALACYDVVDEPIDDGARLNRVVYSEPFSFLYPRRTHQLLL